MLPVQRRIAAGRGTVAEGRDLGTKVFPRADVKFFLDADVQIRAERRHRDIRASGHAAGLDETRRELEARDNRDRTRTQAPLAVPPDACSIDTSKLEVEAVVARMLEVIEARL